MAKNLNINLLAQAWAEILTRQTGIKHIVTECKTDVKSQHEQQKGA